VIAFLTGRLAEKGVGHCLVDVGGVGFRLAMSTSSLASLPSQGDSVTVHTFLYVREDELSLFGFESAEERSLFESLLTVSGVGPKVALAALSSLSPDALMNAIAREDAALIATVPGVGKKTAQRIILDLKDKLGLPDLVGTPLTGAADTDVASEATQALLGMGFSSAEVANALKGYDGAPSDAEALLKHALRRLGGGV
jgi:Holliday junction DNA helicase RuvA